MADHIKIPEQTPRIAYNITTPASSFVIPFAFFAPTDIVVHWNGIFMTQGIHYVVVPTGGYDKGYPGGLVTFVAGDIPLPSGILLIERRVPIARTVDFPNSGPLQTASLNTELDKSVAIDQQLAGDIGALDVRIDILELGDPRLGRALLFPPEDLGLNHSLPAIGNRHDQVLGFRFDGEIEMQRAIVYPHGEIGTNAVLPAAINRANKVLGWDATGNTINLNEVVGGSIVPNAENIIYNAPFPTSTPRTVADKLGEHISIKDFGPDVGIGVQANDDFALNAAITYFNATPPGEGFATLHYPDGVYYHGPCPTAITRQRFAIRGESDGGTLIALNGASPTWLNLGDHTKPLVQHITIGNMSLEGSLVTGTGTWFHIENTVDVTISDLYLSNCDTLIDVGLIGVGASGNSNSTKVNTCVGGFRGKGVPAMRLNAGLKYECHGLAFVSQAPAINNYALWIQGAFQYVSLDRCALDGFDVAVVCIADNGEFVNDVTIGNARLGNCARYAMFLQSNAGGTLRSVHVRNCWIESILEDGILIFGAGGINDNHIFSNNEFARSGKSNFRQAIPATSLIFANNTLGSAGTAVATVGSVEMAPGTSGLTCTGNVNNNNGSVLITNAQYGIHIGANCNQYVVTGNYFRGSIGGYKIDTDSLQSGQRLVQGNGNASAFWVNGYAGVTYRLLDANGYYLNTTPFVQMIAIGNVNPGDVPMIFINVPANHLGVPPPLSGILLGPGDQMNVALVPGASPTLVVFNFP